MNLSVPLDFLYQLHIEPHQAEGDVMGKLERQGNVVYAVVAERDGHCLGLIAISRTTAGAVGTAGAHGADGTADIGSVPVTVE